MAAGCTFLMPHASARTKASIRAGPILKALAAYHRAVGKYPQNLENLRPKWLPEDAELEKSTSGGLVWSLHYKLLDEQNYELWLPIPSATYVTETERQFILTATRSDSAENQVVFRIANCNRRRRD